ncbi:DNA-binding transcriptional regulator CytR [Arenicella sp. 4NH20-0111]|uniref:LacI family DNA-binding transcriptional regulator n=1 Tax=Arenicella sp. 4NH20-0111 TaxID=3127648 RepID=UPI003108CF70
MSDIGIKDLAKHLGISTASVSRALNRPGRVSEAMRERVQTAADKLGYRTNMLGSSLRTSRTRNIVAIIPDLSDTFNSGVIRSMEATAAKAGYSILFGDSQGIRDREMQYGNLVQHKQADGVIFFSARPPFEDSLLESDSFRPPPMVNSCEVVSSDGFLIQDHRIPYVTIDNILAAEEVVTHLIELGHKRIAIITGGSTSPSSQQRLKGYQKAHKKAELALDKELIFEGQYTLDAGESLTREILQLKDRPTAIFCMCDESALGCLHTLRQQGFNVPDDIAVAGFDDIRFANYTDPPLTTVAQPVTELGKRCIEILIKLIEKKPVEETQVILPHKLIVRGSTKKPV